MPVSAPEPLNEGHDLAPFSCGKPSLDNWLKRRTLSNHRKGFTAVMVVHDGGRVVGYYGLAPTAVVPVTLPRAIRTGQLPDPVPCLLLGQLAIAPQAEMFWRRWGFTPSHDDPMTLFRSMADIAASLAQVQGGSGA